MREDPPFLNMTMHCLVTIRSIAYLDWLLPVVLELKETDLISHITFIACNRRTYESIMENRTLFHAIDHFGGRLTRLNRFSNRYLNLLYNPFVLRRYLSDKVLTIEAYTDGWIDFLSHLNRRVWKGKKIKSMLDNWPYRIAKVGHDYYRSIRKDFSTNEDRIKGYDAVLLTHTKAEHEDIRYKKLITDARIIQVGFTSGMRKWQSFLDEHANDYIGEFMDKPYVFFAMSLLGSYHNPGEDCMSPKERFRESLQVLKAFNKDILTVFKPHQKTDMQEMTEILKGVGFRNYAISYAHPHLLIKYARFMFSYHSTSLFVEAYFQGCPTVEYAHYDSRFYAMNQGRSRLLDCVDYFVYRNPDRLREVFRELIEASAGFSRDKGQLQRDFPVFGSGDIREKFDWIQRDNGYSVAG
jgi:hypothetical protein